MFNARANNAGWRIDYFLVSDRIKDKITAARIDDDVLGSDHCPVVLQISYKRAEPAHFRQSLQSV